MLENVVKRSEFGYTREQRYTKVMYYYYYQEVLDWPSVPDPPWNEWEPVFEHEYHAFQHAPTIEMMTGSPVCCSWRCRRWAAGGSTSLKPSGGCVWTTTTTTGASSPSTPGTRRTCCRVSSWWTRPWRDGLDHDVMRWTVMWRARPWRDALDHDVMH